MKVTAINISVFDLPSNTALFDLEEVPYGRRTRWQSRSQGRAGSEIHVLHVLTDEGIEGICTVGDARYQTMRSLGPWPERGGVKVNIYFSHTFCMRDHMKTYIYSAQRA